MDQNFDVANLFQNVVVLGMPGLAIFADIIKIKTIFIKKLFTDSTKILYRPTSHPPSVSSPKNAHPE